MIYDETARQIKIVDVCQNCGTPLHEGDEAVFDNCGLCYCDFDCAYEKFGIEEVYQSNYKSSCENCCETLDFRYETFKDCDDDFYCSKECINNLYGLERKNLEY